MLVDPETPVRKVGLNLRLREIQLVELWGQHDLHAFDSICSFNRLNGVERKVPIQETLFYSRQTEELGGLCTSHLVVPGVIEE